jgi:hypothetical protein
MTTKRQIVDMAYASIGLATHTFDLQPEQLENARRVLDAMMATWNAKGIRVGWPLPSDPNSGDMDEETYLPDSALEAAYMNLGVRIAPFHGKTVPPDYKASARIAYDAMLISIVKPVSREMPGGYPLGSGHKTFNGSAWSADPEARISTGTDWLDV